MALMDAMKKKMKGAAVDPLEDPWDKDPRWIEFHTIPGKLDAEHQRLVTNLRAAEQRRRADDRHGARSAALDQALDQVIDGARESAAVDDGGDAALLEIRAIQEAIKTNRAALRRWERRAMDLRWELCHERIPAVKSAYRETLKTLPGLMQSVDQVQQRLRSLRDLAGNPSWPDLTLPEVSDDWLTYVEQFLRE